ncbi:hypothetical protein BS78_01G418600 [Paspalum vaginatum]|nr:hypothetical protein BS78_01G418600 [Paspalum vaginatum]
MPNIYAAATKTLEVLPATGQISSHHALHNVSTRSRSPCRDAAVVPPPRTPRRCRRRLLPRCRRQDAAAADHAALIHDDKDARSCTPRRLPDTARLKLAAELPSLIVPARHERIRMFAEFPLISMSR